MKNSQTLRTTATADRDRSAMINVVVILDGVGVYRDGRFLSRRQFAAEVGACVISQPPEEGEG